MKLVIADIRDNQEWNWENLSFVLPPLIRDKIRAIPFQDFGDEKDVILWKHTKDGEFTVNSAYLQIIGSAGEGKRFSKNILKELELQTSLLVKSITNVEQMRECLRSLKRNHQNDGARVRRAFETLIIYVRNIAKNPDEEKFRKIRLTNPLFQAKQFP
nr:hypothetical protein CFP56_65818 [Quercus suber]